MKKIIYIATILIVASTLFTGCGNSSSTSGSSTSGGSTSTSGGSSSTSGGSTSTSGGSTSSSGGEDNETETPAVVEGECPGYLPC